MRLCHISMPPKDLTIAVIINKGEWFVVIRPPPPEDAGQCDWSWAQTQTRARQSSSGCFSFLLFLAFHLRFLFRSFTNSSDLWQDGGTRICTFDTNLIMVQIYIFTELQLRFHSNPDRSLSAWWIQMSSQCWNFLSLGFWVSIMIFIHIFCFLCLLCKSRDAHLQRQVAHHLYI